MARMASQAQLDALQEALHQERHGVDWSDVHSTIASEAELDPMQEAREEWLDAHFPIHAHFEAAPQWQNVMHRSVEVPTVREALDSIHSVPDALARLSKHTVDNLVSRIMTMLDAEYPNPQAVFDMLADKQLSNVDHVVLLEFVRRTPMPGWSTLSAVRTIKHGHTRAMYFACLMQAYWMGEVITRDDQMSIIALFTPGARDSRLCDYFNAVGAMLEHFPLVLFNGKDSSFLQAIIMGIPANTQQARRVRFDLFEKAIRYGTARVARGDVTNSAKLVTLLINLFPTERARLDALGLMIPNLNEIDQRNAHQMFDTSPALQTAGKCMADHNNDLRASDQQRVLASRMAAPLIVDQPAAKGEMTCISCCTNRTCIALVPCGHTSMCSACHTKAVAEKPGECSICREKFTSFVHVRLG